MLHLFPIHYSLQDVPRSFNYCRSTPSNSTRRHVPKPPPVTLSLIYCPAMGAVPSYHTAKTFRFDTYVTLTRIHSSAQHFHTPYESYSTCYYTWQDFPPTHLFSHIHTVFRGAQFPRPVVMHFTSASRSSSKLASRLDICRDDQNNQ